MRFKYNLDLYMGTPVEELIPTQGTPNRVFYRLIEPRQYGTLCVQYVCVYKIRTYSATQCILREHPSKVGIADSLNAMMQRIPGMLVDTTEAFEDRI